MEELAQAAAGMLAFRLAHFQDQRWPDVLEMAAKRFDWAGRTAKKDTNVGVGLACGTEKGGYVAAWRQVTVNRAKGTFTHPLICGMSLNAGRS